MFWSFVHDVGSAIIFYYFFLCWLMTAIILHEEKLVAKWKFKHFMVVFLFGPIWAAMMFFFIFFEWMIGGEIKAADEYEVFLTKILHKLCK
jgi:hypothetical protein